MKTNTLYRSGSDFYYIASIRGAEVTGRLVSRRTGITRDQHFRLGRLDETTLQDFQTAEIIHLQEATAEDWQEFRHLKNVAEANKEVSRIEQGRRSLLRKKK
jgi:hypothetical protein